MRWQQLPKAVGNRDLPLVLFKLPIRPRLSLGTFVGNVVVGLFLLEFDLGKRDLDLFVLINPDAVQPSLFIELIFYGRVQPGDRDDHLLAGERAGFRPVGNEERELQIRRQVAVVGHQSLGGDIGERVVVGQPEGHTDPIILVLLRQRRRLDLGWLLDWDRRSVVQFEVLLTQVHGLEIQPVPVTSLAVDGVDTSRVRLSNLNTQLIWPSCSMISVTVPVQPPKGMSGKSGTITPYLTRTLFPTWKRGEPDLFLVWLMVHSSADSFV